MAAKTILIALEQKRGLCITQSIKYEYVTLNTGYMKSLWFFNPQLEFALKKYYIMNCYLNTPNLATSTLSSIAQAGLHTLH